MNANQYSSLYQQETVSRWEQSTSWCEYFSLLWMDFTYYWEESFDFGRIQERIAYVLDHFSISISVRSVLFAVAIVVTMSADCCVSYLLIPCRWTKSF